MAEHEDRPFTCERCGNWPMKIVSTTPKVATMPELRTLRCDYCGNVDTVAHDPEVEG